MDAAELTEEINLCDQCYATAGEPTVVDFIDNPFARCERCETASEDVDLVSVKREDVQ